MCCISSGKEGIGQVSLTMLSLNYINDSCHGSIRRSYGYNIYRIVVDLWMNCNN